MRGETTTTRVIRLLRHVGHHCRVLELLVLVISILHSYPARQRSGILRLTTAINRQKAVRD